MISHTIGLQIKAVFIQSNLKVST